MKIEESKLLLIWGLTTFLGWIFTGIGYMVPLTAFTVLSGWIGLMVIPVAISLKKFYSGMSDNVFNVWALAVAAIMIQNILINRFLIFSYFTLWLVVGAVAYYYTASKLPPPSEKTYLYAAAINLALIPLIYFVPLKHFTFLAALVQSAPIFYDYWSVHL
jgi:hypothetical protein